MLDREIHQGHLFNVLTFIFPSYKISVNSRKKTTLKNPGSKFYCELDLWIPELHICFEFQDPYHYVTTWYSHNPVDDIKHSDTIKASLVRLKGDTLVIVPCWWDGECESLVGLISFHRPDLLHDLVHSDPRGEFMHGIPVTFHDGPTIQLNPHDSFFLRPMIPGVGELMAASYPPSTLSVRVQTSIPFIPLPPSPNNNDKYHDYINIGNISDNNNISDNDNIIDNDGDHDSKNNQISEDTGNSTNGSSTMNGLSINGVSTPFFCISSWWIGEKYDGVRCCWNASHQALYSRHGHLLTLSASFLTLLPTILLDTELWFGRGQFLEAQRIVGASQYIDWQFLRIIAFDMPISSPGTCNRAATGEPGHCEPTLEHRYATLLTHIPPDSAFITIPPRVHCLSHAECHVYAFVDHIIQYGGEGVILQACRSAYQHGRSSSLLKLKASDRDQEGLVLSYSKIQGLTLKLVTGNIITIPPSHLDSQIHQLASTPKAGDIIEFESFEHRRALPAHVLSTPTTAPTSFSTQTSSPSVNHIHLLRIRNDITWKDALYSFWSDFTWAGDNSVWTTSHDLSSFRQLNDSSKILKSTKHQNKLLDVQWGEVTSRRAWFINYAAEHGFDALLASNWYHVKFTEATGTQMLRYYSGRLDEAISHLFPEIRFDKAKYNQGGYWHNTDNRLRFFEKFAMRHGFDPLSADNWYSVTKPEIVSQKGGSAILNYYSGSPKRALLHIFPHIGLKESMFAHVSLKHWDLESNQRAFFEEYAASQNFNPLATAGWYNTVQSSILAKKGGSRILGHYQFSFKRALQHLFPELTFDANKFQKLPRNHWNTIENRKEFFIDFAKTKGFEPNTANNWDTVTKAAILSVKGGNSVLKYYNGSYKRALQQLFPNILHGN